MKSREADGDAEQFLSFFKMLKTKCCLKEQSFGLTDVFHSIYLKESQAE